MINDKPCGRFGSRMSQVRILSSRPLKPQVRGLSSLTFFVLCPEDREKWHGNFVDALNPKLFRGLEKSGFEPATGEFVEIFKFLRIRGFGLLDLLNPAPIRWCRFLNLIISRLVFRTVALYYIFAA